MGFDDSLISRQKHDYKFNSVSVAMQAKNEVKRAARRLQQRFSVRRQVMITMMHLNGIRHTWSEGITCNTIQFNISGMELLDNVMPQQ